MILGNAGIVSVIISATSSFVTSKSYNLPINFFILLLGIALIYKIATYKGFIRRWESFIEDKLAKSSYFEEEPVEDLLHFLEGYGLVRTSIKKDSPVEGFSFSECKLCHEDLVVLGIERGKKWIPIPKSDEKIREGDKMVIYGDLQSLKGILKDF
jgi:K+/H+ antiporter YhaU regulatory subunit KhtT